MTVFESVETPISRRAHPASEAPIIISQDDARQDPAERRALYILGFGTAGAIFANAAIFAYFALLYASG
jgi:hypothetical protein